ncbi:MAG: hypothetical protein AB7L09_00670 [Nitrospira sp.]
MDIKKPGNQLVGGSVVMRNGMVGEIIGVRNEGTWREELEVLVDGTRCYVEASNVKVLNVLDRIVGAMADDEQIK